MVFLSVPVRQPLKRHAIVLPSRGFAPETAGSARIWPVACGWGLARNGQGQGSGLAREGLMVN